MSEQVRTHEHCRICPGMLRTVLDLGPLHVSAFPAPGMPDTIRAPLDLCRCVACGLVQLRHSVDPAYLYQEYWYRSGINETMIVELHDVVAQAMTWIDGLSDGDWVVDIGANDGTLLRQYPDPAWCAVVRVAYEPARNLQAALRPHAEVIVPQAFPPGPSAYRVPKAAARIVTSIACVYDLDDPIAFAAEVKRILAPDGVWILQLQDLHQMIQATAFDNVCHEHVTYLDLDAIDRIVRAVGLEVAHVERRAINGGSLRVFVQKPGARPVQDSVVAWLAREAGSTSWVTLETFAHRVRERQRQIVAVVARLQARGQVIDLYGASTKANTLLQSCGIGRTVLRQAWERTEAKWGMETVGGRIPIVEEAVGRANPPDVLLVGAWQFRDAFLEREAAYLASGRVMVLPLPEVEIVQGGA